MMQYFINSMGLDENGGDEFDEYESLSDDDDEMEYDEESY